MKSNIFLLIILGVAACHGQRFNYTEIDLKGDCPKIKYINNFNYPRVCGFYYEAFCSLSSPQCFNGNEGLTMYAAPYDDQTLSINFCCRSASSPSDATCGSKVASGTVKLTNNPGEMVYAFNDKVYNIYILDTDYDNFTVIYGCNPGSRRHQGHDEIILIHSRHYQLSESLEGRVRKAIQGNGGDWSKAKPIKQGPKMAYTPNSPRPLPRLRHCD